MSNATLDTEVEGRAKRVKRSHYCRYCGKSFSRAEHRTRHERSHTKETPFSCLHCPKSFARKYVFSQSPIRKGHCRAKLNRDLLVRHSKSLHGEPSQTEATEENDTIALARAAPTQDATRWYNWQPPRTAQTQPVENVTRSDPASRPNGTALAGDQTVNTTFSRQESHHSDQVDMSGLQGLEAHDFLSESGFDPNAMIDASMNCAAEQDGVVSGQALSDLPALSNNPLDATLMDPFFEPDWIDNFDFAATTFSSVFQTALPMWPTMTWSPNSLTQPPESPKDLPESLRKILPTPGNGQSKDIVTKRPEGNVSLLDRVFSQASSLERSVALSRSYCVTSDIRAQLILKMQKFVHILPPSFTLPPHHALNRYTSMYFDAGARHQPFLHEKTWDPSTCNLGLFLAVCAMGARYCFETSTSRQLWSAGKVIIRFAVDEAERLSGEKAESQNDLLEVCQGLLLLMIYATWAGEKHFLRQALVFQSGLAVLARELSPVKPSGTLPLDWKQWIEYEAQKRTKFVIFCFFNLQCLAYDLPALMMFGELEIELPSREELWRASTEADWMRLLGQESDETPRFPETMRTLLDQTSHSAENDSGHTSPADLSYSIFASYILINGLMQHGSELRRYVHSLSGPAGAPPTDQIMLFERALRKWQKGWESHPKASLDPHDPQGPLAFNCTALLRMAYIRLEMDFAPYAAALRSGDPQVVARTIFNEPPAKRSRRSMRAALHAWHALLIPIRMGIDLVAQTQVFLWSIQHFLASFECCLLLAKWLNAVTVESPSPPLSDEERWLIKLVQDTLQEAGINTVNDLRILSSNVLTTWAKLFHGNKIWGFVPLIGDALTQFADLLTERS